MNAKIKMYISGVIMVISLLTLLISTSGFYSIARPRFADFIVPISALAVALVSMTLFAVYKVLAKNESNPLSGEADIVAQERIKLNAKRINKEQTNIPSKKV